MRRGRFAGKSVVITGASTGLGRAAALTFAREGANVALLARDRAALEDVAAEVSALGSRALVIALDVTDAEAMLEAAANIARELGSIDVWANNAGVMVYGEVLDVPLEEMKRVMDVNFFGHVNGVRAALPYLEEARGVPVIIGVLSVLAEAAAPLLSVYTASKHALDGFYESLSEELAHRRSRVRVATLFTPAMATPLYDHAKTYIGYKPRPPAPVYPPAHHARRLVEMAARPKQRVRPGAFARVASFGFRYVPRLARWVEARVGYATQRSDELKRPSEGDNLFAVMPAQFEVRGSTSATPFIVPLERVGASLLALGVGLAAARSVARPGLSSSAMTLLAGVGIWAMYSSGKR